MVCDDLFWVGLNVGEFVGIGKKDVDCIVLLDLSGNDVDVMIDFILFLVIESNFMWCVKNKMFVVIGIIGLNDL